MIRANAVTWMRTLSVGTLLIAPVVGTAGAAADFDPTIHGITAAPFTLDNNGAPRALWNASASVFREGDRVGLNCNAGGPPKNKNDKFENFTIFFLLDGKLLASLSRQQNFERVEALVWTAAGVGTHTLECRVDTNASGNKANDSANVAILVKPYVAGEPGVMYYGAFGRAEAPGASSPEPGQRFVLRPDLKIDVLASVPGGAYTVSWAQHSPYDEQWHIDVVRRGSGKLGAAEALVLQDSGPITAEKFGTTLGDWFVKSAGAGSYAARVYFTQKRPDGLFVSASSRVEFEVVAPLTASASGSDGAASGSLLTVGPAAAAAAAGDRAPQRAAKPAGESGPPAAVAAGRVLAAMSRSQGNSHVFESPLVDGKRVDVCLHWGSECGQPAADAFCRQSGFAKAAEFVVAQDIGAQSPTLVLGDGKVCADAGCDGFARIRCSE